MPSDNRAALYARVSTDEQAMKGYSLDAQLEKMRQYCEIYNLQIAGEYVDDGYSGTKCSNRPAYKRMFEERKNWDILIVLKMDRIHRNTVEFIHMMDDLRKHNQQFISTFEKFSTKTASGRFALDMIQRVAQLESEQIGERTYIGMRQKAETNGGIMGFNPPFGYGLEGGELFPIEEELDTVRDIFSMYLSGMPLTDIAYNLNRGCRLTRKGNPWNKYNLRNVLHNPVYAGYMRWEDVLIHPDAGNAVSPEDYNAVQELMASKVRDPSKRTVFLVPILRLRTIVY